MKTRRLVVAVKNEENAAGAHAATEDQLQRGVIVVQRHQRRGFPRESLLSRRCTTSAACTTRA